MKPITELKVGLDFGLGVQPVGRLATRAQIIYFEYNDTFAQQGIELSPFRLPLKRGLMEFPSHLFEGLPGVFSDSLADGWGRLLFDRLIRSKGILPSSLSPLDRLANVGLSGMGALVYQPDYSISDHDEIIDLDNLATLTQEVLQGDSQEVIEALLALNGSSAGARPKALIAVDKELKKIRYGVGEIKEGYQHWLLKFSNSNDGDDAGAIEYVYALMAKEAGILMPEVHLFSSNISRGYFAVKRFDRENEKRFHMHTAGGLLHSDFRVSSLDYEDLINLTGALTKDIREKEKMYRLAVFNVLAHNRDDHAKNFSYLMDKLGRWALAPGYDITFSSGPNGEQSTMVMGEGKNPKIVDLIKLGQEAGLAKALIKEIIDQTRNALANWTVLAKNHNVRNTNIKLIKSKIEEHL